LKVRKPAAYGFYETVDKNSLLKQLEACFLGDFGPGKLPSIGEKIAERGILSIVSPHAGYYYSGQIAAHGFYALASEGRPDTVVIIGPSHYGWPGVALMSSGFWESPLGLTEIDTELARTIEKKSVVISEEDRPHRPEHSLEVELPFLQYIFGAESFEIVPIAMGLMDYNTSKETGEGIASAIKESEKEVLIVSSTDLTHYGAMYGYYPIGTSPIEKVIGWVHETDGKIIKTIESLDAKGLIDLVINEGLTMCGCAPVAAGIIAAKALGATKGRTLKYATSYDVRGSKDAIVGYLSASIEK
jgi:AmmeMemoRadiSam system protein B